MFALLTPAAMRASTKTWTGPEGTHWSQAGNWNVGAAPVNGDSLFFPPIQWNTFNSNDLAGLSLGSIAVDGGDWQISGNPIVLTGGIAAPEAGMIWSIPITLGASQTFDGRFQLQSPVSLNGHTLTVTSLSVTGSFGGAGAVVVAPDATLSIAGSASSIGGAFTVSGGASLDVVNASIAASGLSVQSGARVTGRDATLPAMSSVGGIISPGANLYGDEPNGYGVLSTGALSLHGGTLVVDVVVDFTGTHWDQLKVSGPISMAGTTLQLRVPRGLPVAGQQFVLIDNDGADPVAGTFTGLPQGASLTADGVPFTISYRGGDGNDVVVTAGAVAMKAWTGPEGVSWSSAGNWNPGGAPAAGDALFFPGGAWNTFMTNDVTGLSLSKIVVDEGSDYKFFGNPIALSGGISGGSALISVWNIPVMLTAPQTFDGRFLLSAGVDLNGQSLTITNLTVGGPIVGSGSVVVAPAASAIWSGSSSFTGTLTVSSGATLQVVTALASSALVVQSGGSLLGQGGSVPSTTLVGAELSPGYLATQMPATLPAGSLDMQGGSFEEAILIDQNGARADAIQVTGTVTLSAPALHVVVPGLVPAPGQVFTIIDNDGADAVVGTFAGLPEGATLTVASGGVSIPFTVSYHGGDGNDVVLTAGTADAKAWIGTLGTGNWSAGANWNVGVPPVGGDTLSFPSLPFHSVLTNDVAGLTLARLNVAPGPGYEIGGDAFVLDGGITSAGQLTLAAPVTLGASQTFDGRVSLIGLINLNGHTLTVSAASVDGSIGGAGALVVSPAGSLSVAGGVNVTSTVTASEGSHLHVTGTIEAPLLDVRGGARVTGLGGSLPATTIAGGELAPGMADTSGVEYTNGAATLATGPLSMQGGVLEEDVILDFQGAHFDQVRVSGTVSLQGTHLELHVPAGIPAPGQSYVVIDNDGTDPISGTFAGLPEGAAVTAGHATFLVSYRGGDGNDVVLIAVASPSGGGASPAAVPALGPIAALLLVVGLGVAGTRLLRT